MVTAFIISSCGGLKQVSTLHPARVEPVHVSVHVVDYQLLVGS